MDSRQRVAIVVAHELAHQWFGNLVVCAVCSWIAITRSLFLLFRQWTAIVYRYGDEQTQESLRALYTAAEMTEEKVRLLRSMGQSPKPEIIEKTLAFIFDAVGVPLS